MVINSLALVAAVIIVLWLVMLVLYFLVSRQQPNLRQQIGSLEKELDEQDGRPAADHNS